MGNNQYTKDNKRDLVEEEIELFRSKKIIISRRKFSMYLMEKYPLQFLNFRSTWSCIGSVTGKNGKKTRNQAKTPINMYDGE